MGDNHGSFPFSICAHSDSELVLRFEIPGRTADIYIARCPRSLTRIAASTASDRKPGDGKRRRVLSVERVA